jgi:hypothetical protein
MINQDYAYNDRQLLISGAICRTILDEKREAARKWLDTLPEREYVPEVATVLGGAK